MVNVCYFYCSGECYDVLFKGDDVVLDIVMCNESGVLIDLIVGVIVIGVGYFFLVFMVYV